jgi:transcriptional regulator GlxA family with amidase domain
MTRHLAALFAFDEFQLLDVTGPAAVFGVANSILGRDAYVVQVVSASGGLVRSNCGISLQSQSIAKVRAGTVDTLLVAGGNIRALKRATSTPITRRWIPRCIRTCTRFGSVCSGAYLLAELGQLSGLRIATHWANCDDLAARFPDIAVDSNALFVVQGKAWTSAGVTTGIDMALAMVEQDVGRSVADKIAKFLVLYARRPGYQSQFSELLKAQASAGTPFAELTNWMQTQLGQRLDVPTLAAKVGLSERTFYRRFVAAIGQTPAHFVENIRLDAARALLATNLPLKAIAARTGIRSTVRLNTEFARRFGLSPSLFRQVHHSRGGSKKRSLPKPPQRATPP